ncbi:hypothetical protein [Mangrovicoccus algicola]|uniref:Uncharacterized protein n=1 Tax=Mangrovicoccus algicola TaxID=2771008 RepID=A0A8J7D005_9RHOB|nr:hypothetical protein [Mangrovicoccus algicola]MBE3638743.1 hypothetical protein [Mangrovicoccus algicola]
MKIPLDCSLADVFRRAAFMRAHPGEVALSLRRERVRHAAWHLWPEAQPCVIGVMDVADAGHAAAVARGSDLAVDRVHGGFKRHWRRAEMHPVQFDPLSPDPFPSCRLLFEARG